MTGVAEFLARLRKPTSGTEGVAKERIVLNHFGKRLDTQRKENQQRGWVYHPEIVRSNSELLFHVFHFTLFRGHLEVINA